MQNNLKIQKCSLSDLDKLVQVSRKTFVEAFEKDNNPHDFKAYFDIAFAKSTIKEELKNEDSAF